MKEIFSSRSTRKPYEIALAQATAQLGVATAHLELAERQLARATNLQESDAGTVENLDQRTGISEQRKLR